MIRLVLRPFVASIAALGLLALVAAPAPAAPTRTGSAGPVVAVEDTMHAEVSPVLVSAPRVTLDEILDRVARGEAHRESLLTDESYLMTLRVVGHAGSEQKSQLLEESVSQVWKRRPNRSRVVELRHWYLHPPKKEKARVGISVETSDDMSEEIVNFAFRPSARADFRFRIEGRELLGDHLIYRIAFAPRSPLALDLPGGTVWVDTRDFVIVRQELSFRQSPVPLFLRGIKRVVIERERVGDLWMLSRLLARIDSTLPLPRLGRSFDLGVQFTQYALNTGLPDSIFAVPAAAAPAAPKGAGR